MKTLTVTDKQLQIIRDACELYGRIQIGQFNGFAEIVTQTGFNGWNLRVDPKRKEEQSEDAYEFQRHEMLKHDSLVCKALIGAITGIYREAYSWDPKDRPDEANVALDIWAVLDGRREDGFHMGSEPLIKVEEGVE